MLAFLLALFPQKITPSASVSILIFPSVPVCDSQADCKLPAMDQLGVFHATGRLTTAVANDSIQNEKGSYMLNVLQILPMTRRIT